MLKGDKGRNSGYRCEKNLGRNERACALGCPSRKGLLGASRAHARGLARARAWRANERTAGVRGGWYWEAGDARFKVTWGKAREERVIPGHPLAPDGSWCPLRASFPDPGAQSPGRPRGRARRGRGRGGARAWRGLRPRPCPSTPA